MIQDRFGDGPRVRGLRRRAWLLAWHAVLLGLAGLARAGETEGLTGLAAIKVPPGFAVELAAGPDVAPYGMLATFDERGRLFVAESSGKDVKGKDMPAAPECRIRLLEDTDGDGRFDRSRVFADKLSLPMGVLWHRGSLFVASPPDFLRFDDRDGDGVADHREVLLTGWNVFNTASLHGPFLGPDGWLYLTHGRHGYRIRTKEGVLLEGLASRIWRCRPDGTGLERVCGGGFDNPVELIFTPPGEMLGTMTYFTDPQNGQRDALMHWVEGGVYHKWHECVKEFKLTGELMPPMTRFARIAPSGLMQYRGSAFGPDYRGNLFSAQFNPHRIQRHVLSRDGATFRTQDEDFLTSADPDFHPCDVLEDADGSLLVVDTGGWYVDACPLSRVSKPEIRGGIYRIRKVGAPRVADPWGRALDWAKLPPARLAELLADARPAVQDHALEALVAAGEQAVVAVGQFRRQTPVVEAGCLAVRALARVATPAALAELRAALADGPPEVRMAAAHGPAMARDPAAVEGLLGLLSAPEPFVRRAAASALGRLGDARAVPLLLTAARGVHDRFLGHALTYALIQLKAATPARVALTDADASVRQFALIALDQMDDSPLHAEHVTPFLRETAVELRRSAWWVMAHHPEWSGTMVRFLRAELGAAELGEREAAGLRDALLAFCADQGVQALVSEILRGPAASAERRLLLLDVMNRCALKELPTLWVEALSEQMRLGTEPVRLRALSVIRTRGVSGLKAELARLSSDAGQPSVLRLAALEALAAKVPKLDAAQFEFLGLELRAGKDAAERSTAAQVLGKARLSEAQSLAVANGLVAEADALTLPSLLESFRGNPSDAVGQAMVAALVRRGTAAALLGTTRLQQLLAPFPTSVRAAAEPLLAQARQAEAGQAQRLKDLEPLLRGGDVGRGRRVFFEQKAACSTCHPLGGEGGTLGPDLTAIGGIRSGRDLLEAIAFPSASFVPGYEPYRVETADDLLSGVLGEQTSDAIVLKVAANSSVRIPRQTIQSLAPSAVSVMPEGLDSTLSTEELRDLLAFLQAQNGEAWLQPQRLGSEH